MSSSSRNETLAAVRIESRVNGGRGENYVAPSDKTNQPNEAHHRGRRGKTPARLWLRQNEGFRSVSAVRRLPQRESVRLPGRISLASAPRNRDDYIRAGRLRRARRQLGQQGQNDRRRRAMDDGRQRHPAP